MHLGTTTARPARAGRSSALLLAVLVAMLAAVLTVAGAVIVSPERRGPSSAGSGLGFGRVGGADALARRVPALQARVRDVPGDYTAWAALGLAYVEQTRVTADTSWYPKADGALQRSLSINGDDNFAAYAGLAALALGRHDFAAARSFAERGLAINPSNPLLHGALGDAETQLGRYDEAFAAIQRMADISPDTASLARVSYTWELRGDVGRATEYMQRALDAASSPADRAFARYHLGELALSTGDPAGALAHHEAGLRADPSFVRLLEGRAKAHAALGRSDLAVDGYRQVVDRLPEPGLIVQYGELLESLGRTDEAAEQYRLFGSVAQLFERNGARLDADATLFFADHGDPAEALRQAEAGLRNRPFIDMEDAYAWALHRNGRHQEALLWSDRARRLGTRNALFSFHAGLIRRSLGDVDGARAELSSALQTNPQFSPVWAPIARAALAEMSGGV